MGEIAGVRKDVRADPAPIRRAQWCRGRFHGENTKALSDAVQKCEGTSSTLDRGWGVVTPRLREEEAESPN